MEKPPQLQKLFENDGYLRTFEEDILMRYGKFRDWERTLQNEGGLAAFAEGYKYHGLMQRDNGDIDYCEWVPDAKSVSLVGQFNGWDTKAHVCTKGPYNKFSLHIPAGEDGQPAIPHLSKLRVVIHTVDGKELWRISPWCRYAVQIMEEEPTYQWKHWAPRDPYEWKHPRPERPSSVRIYEAHVGISSDEPKVASYRHFADNVIPYVASLGYTYVELMAVMEHAYYGSFGYHVTNFFAVSSRYGTPDDLKYLVDKAHGLGLSVILDIVHSHAATNVLDGLNKFNGTDHCYFHAGKRGQHTLWDSKLFDYSKWEVLRFLLSNLRWYIEEYRFDGFRFDGVTSMLYHHHGIATGFSGNYQEYFNTSVDVEALTYLMLANQMLHTTYPFVITVAEDVSGMPTLGRPIEEGGLGFDYRLAMAIPDEWIKLLKEKKDEDWNMENIWWTLTNRRLHEKCIAYAESHDQALVGDKTLSFWLMDAEMYHNMSILSPRTPVIDRGMALHKMIRLVTMGLGGEAYLTFIGNEFGHPEWLDFPREGNGFSYKYARRQMSLAHDHLLRYQFLRYFDAAMQHLDKDFQFLTAGPAYVSRKHNIEKVMVFERGGLLWVFNFNPSTSFTDYRVGVGSPGTYRLRLCSDSTKFDGHGRIQEDCEYHTTPGDWDGRGHSLMVYIPSRVAIVLCKK